MYILDIDIDIKIDIYYHIRGNNISILIRLSVAILQCYLAIS